ncbi:MAG: hypothetical protein V9H26_26515 [Verrucomicrobiota bacterium]
MTEAILAVDAETGDYDPHFLQNQYELIESPPVLADTLQRLQSQPVDSMELRTVAAHSPVEVSRLLSNCITVGPVRGTRLIDIRAVVREPHEAAAVANAVAESYRDQAALLWNAKQPRLKEVWERRLARYPELQAAHRRVAGLLKDLKVSPDEYYEVELKNQMGWDHVSGALVRARPGTGSTHRNAARLFPAATGAQGSGFLARLGFQRLKAA